MKMGPKDDATPRRHGADNSRDDHDILFGNTSSRTRAGDHEGNPGSAETPDRPCLLGPDGNPIRSVPDPPFGFR